MLIPGWQIRHAALRKLSRNGGQSTVEFAVVTAALLVIVVGLGAIWHLFADGVVVDHAVAAAAYHTQGGNDGVLADVFAA